MLMRCFGQLTPYEFTKIVCHMHILVLGGGGREHAIVKALKLSPKLKHISCAPGNPGIAQEATCYLTDPTDVRKVLDLAQRIKPDLTVIGPEGPLAAGTADVLRRYDFLVFGPSREAAQIEKSKVFSKKFMEKHGIPTAPAKVCGSAEEVMQATAEFSKPWVLKADGLASGKGVSICKDEVELKSAIIEFFEKKTFGAAAQKVLVEKYIEGNELSVMALVSGGKYELLPVSQDYKRLLDGGKGPNTGGMGAYAPVKNGSKVLKKIEEKIIIPTVEGLKKDGLEYRGVLYFGIMMEGSEPYLLEYNVRFGDPEAQVLMPLLDGQWADVLSAVAAGKLPKLKWKRQAAVCVVIAAPGYPEHPKKGIRIQIDRKLCSSSSSNYILHASTASHRGYFTNGGRVLNAVGIDKSLKTARKKAYDIIKGVEMLESHYRKDIALVKGE